MTRASRTTGGRKTWTGAAAAFAASALIMAGTGCSSGDSGRSTPRGEDQGQADGARAVAAPSVSPSAAQGKGRLVVTYEKGKTAAGREAEAFLKKNRVLEDVAAYADETIALPQDVPLRGRSCGTPNTFWSSETRTSATATSSSTR